MNEAGNSEHNSAEAVPEHRARAILWMLENNAPSVNQALQEFAPKTYAKMMADLRAFEATTHRSK